MFGKGGRGEQPTPSPSCPALLVNCFARLVVPATLSGSAAAYLGSTRRAKGAVWWGWGQLGVSWHWWVAGGWLVIGWVGAMPGLNCTSKRGAPLNCMQPVGVSNHSSSFKTVNAIFGTKTQPHPATGGEAFFVLNRARLHHAAVGCNGLQLSALSCNYQH